MAMSKGKKSTSYSGKISGTGSSSSGTMPTSGQKYSGGQVQGKGGRGNATRGMTMGKGGGKGHKC